MASPALITTAPIGPIEALAAANAPGTLALITGTDGPSYRPVGAMMAVLEGRRRVGSLSSGCVEADIALHAETVLADGAPKLLKYGSNSPFKDIQLPCGGGLEILLLPAPDRAVLADAAARFAARQVAALVGDAGTGALSLGAGEGAAQGWQGRRFHWQIAPEIMFYIFGKGPEASSFAALVQSAGYPSLVLGPDDETLAAAEASGSAVRHLNSASFPKDLEPDSRSAIVLFFHDHDWEPAILKGALASPAFYIGAQGSRRARHLREFDMMAMGVTEAQMARMRGPIGLIASARDARTLAVSVLAEVLAEA